MSNNYDDDRAGLESPAAHAYLITPNNDVDVAEYTRGIAFATEGTLKVEMFGGDIVEIPSGVLAPGMIHPLRVKRVYATGTSVTNILGVW